MADELRDIEDLEPSAEDAANVQGGVKKAPADDGDTSTSPTKTLPEEESTSPTRKG